MKTLFSRIEYGDTNNQGKYNVSSGNLGGTALGHSIPTSGWENISGTTANVGATLNSGENTYQFSKIVNGSPQVMNIPSYKTLYFRIYYAGGGVPTGTSDRILSNLKFKVGTTYKTLQQMVADEDIEPIVIINSNGRKRLTAKTYMEDAINLYTGGDAIYCRWSNIDLILMTKNTISGFTVTTQDTTLNINNEGWLALMQDTSDFRLTLNEW